MDLEAESDIFEPEGKRFFKKIKGVFQTPESVRLGLEKKRGFERERAAQPFYHSKLEVLGNNELHLAGHVFILRSEGIGLGFRGDGHPIKRKGDEVPGISFNLDFKLASFKNVDELAKVLKKGFPPG